MSGAEDEGIMEEDELEIEEVRSPASKPMIGTEDIREVMTAVTQYTELAASLRQKGQLSRAIRMTERAVVMCTRAESGHPALAVEAARARLNLGAALSEGHRHREALANIREAQKSLAQVLNWANECNAEDGGVKSIEQEARALRCAALVAEAIQLELCPNPEAFEEPPELTRPPAVASPGAGRRSPPERANSTGAIGQSPSHGKSASLAVTAAAATSSSTPTLPPIGQASAPLLRQGNKKQLASNEDPDSGQNLSSPAPGRQTKRPGASNERGQAVKLTSKRPGANADERTDVFSDFLRSVESERVARLGALNDNREEQARRRLAQVHRTTRLQLELSADDDLKEKRYTHTGHQVFMKAMKKQNKCWNDPVILTDAQKEKVSPEICQVRKLNRKLFVKPPTPPPAPPPQKPKVDTGIAGNLRGNARSSIAANTKPGDF